VRSAADRRCLVAGAALLIALAVPLSARQDPPVVATPEATQELDEVAIAIETVKKDPNLGGERTMKMLRWRDRGKPQKPTDLSWVAWIGGLFSWVGQSSRYLIWVVVVVLVAWLAVYVWRAVREKTATGSLDPFVAPTHVRNLDIRPESLPPNIGRAARALWDKGDHRAALSLLYRGLLSRLTHVHRVPIRDSSTEGDCLLLIEGRVSPNTNAYTARLVTEWCGFVYGGTITDAPTVHALCDEFGGALDRGAAGSARGATP
jgi:hypothetical protein